MKWLGYIIVVVLCVLFVLLGMLNAHTVQFDYLLNKHEIPLIIVMLVSFMFGALMTLVVFGFKAMFWRSRAKRLQAQIDRERRDAYHEAVKAQFEAESASV